ncbi:MAG: immunity 26/phosphotriesterase HocA family protein [Pyrinomonadaceae bacterium]|nr:immunity 26/phosphotriesterase HocA family protein [Pyrinomonadaceae bacterium]
MRKKLNYKEGSWFAVPLKPDGFAVGVVARMAPKGRIVIAYFFGDRYLSIPDLSRMQDYSPRDAIRILKIGDLGLINGEWEIIGELPDWNREIWKTPVFGRQEEFTNRNLLIIYNDDDPSELIAEEPVNYDVAHLEEDALCGYLGVETKLSKLLNKN